MLLEGQYAGGLLDSIVAGGSCGSDRYSTTRSTELSREWDQLISDAILGELT